MPTKVKFRFEDLEIWQMAIELGDGLFDIADKMEEKVVSLCRST